MNLFTKKKDPEYGSSVPVQVGASFRVPFLNLSGNALMISLPLDRAFEQKTRIQKTYCGLLKRSSEIVWEKFFEFLTYLCINFNSSSCRNKYKSKCKIQKINLIGGAEVLLYLYELGCFAYHSHPLYYVIALQLVYDFFSIIKLNTGWSFLYFPKARTQILILQPSHWR